MLAVMRFMKKIVRRVCFRNEGIDQIGRAGRGAQRRNVIAPVEIPFEMRAMADAENDISIDERRFHERTKGRGVGTETDAKIDMGSDHTEEGTLFRSGRQLVHRTGGEGVPEKREGFDRIGRIAVGMMLGG